MLVVSIQQVQQRQQQQQQQLRLLPRQDCVLWMQLAPHSFDSLSILLTSSEWDTVYFSLCAFQYIKHTHTQLSKSDESINLKFSFDTKIRKPFSHASCSVAFFFSVSQPSLHRLNPLQSAKRTCEHDNRKAVSEMQQWKWRKKHKTLAYEYKSETNSREAICANVLLYSVASLTVMMMMAAPLHKSKAH